ncbi:MAG: hydrogenase maturation protease [Acidobacteriota bacterium]
MGACVVGVGQEMAGDDGVGLAVAREAARRGIGGLSVVEAAEPSDLLPLFEEHTRVVIVDAFLGKPEGEVRTLSADELSRARRPVSSHGITVAQAIDLARALHGGATEVRVVGIAIALVGGLDRALSPPVAAAVAPACELAIALALGENQRA